MRPVAIHDERSHPISASYHRPFPPPRDPGITRISLPHRSADQPSGPKPPPGTGSPPGLEHHENVTTGSRDNPPWQENRNLQARPEAANAPKPPFDPAKKALARKTLRRVAGLLGLPHLCRHSACRRTGECRQNPQKCLPALTKSVPEEARAWVRGLIEAQDRGLDFDEALEEIAEWDEAYSAWIEGLNARSKRR